MPSNFSWAGTSAYAPPPGSAADLAFQAGSATATGFVSTAFGAPSQARVQGTTGFASGAFGTPAAPLTAEGIAPAGLGMPFGMAVQGAAGFLSATFGTPQVVPIAVGFVATRMGVPWMPLPAATLAPATAFGAPQGGLFQRPVGFCATVFSAPGTPLPATGFLATQLGAPNGSQRWSAASLGMLTRFSRAYYAFVQTASVQGFAPARLGTPMVTTFSLPDTTLTAQAWGFAATALGAPGAAWRQTGQTAGFAATRLGAPALARAGQAQGFGAAMFGTGQVHLRGRAAGFLATTLGLPHAAGAQAAVSAYRPTRFGLASAWRPNAYSAYGINRAGRLGQPRGTARLNRTASGILPGHLGAPASLERHRCAFLAPTSAFGQPLLKRAPAC